MMINTNDMIPMQEANQNFSKVTRKVDEQGAVVILKNNVPRYVVIDFAQFEQMEAFPKESLDAIAQRVLNENRIAFEELAK